MTYTQIAALFAHLPHCLLGSALRMCLVDVRCQLSDMRTPDEALPQLKAWEMMLVDALKIVAAAQ